MNYVKNPNEGSKISGPSAGIRPRHNGLLGVALKNSLLERGEGWGVFGLKNKIAFSAGDTAISLDYFDSATFLSGRNSSQQKKKNWEQINKSEVMLSN